MKLKKILFSEGRSKEISRQKLIEYLKNDRFNLYDDITYMERKIGEFNSTYGIVRPSNYTRKSAVADNYYTLIIDNSKLWKKYPKRSKSIVCRTVKRERDANGYLVVPMTGAKIGVLPTYDIWGGFRGAYDIHSLNNDFNTFIDLIAAYAKGELQDYHRIHDDELSGQVPDKNYSQFKSYIEWMDEEIKSDPEKNYKEIKNIINDGTQRILIDKFIKSKFDKLFNFLEDILNPNKNNFKLKRYNSDFNVEKNREVWTDAPSLLIKPNKIESIKLQLERE